ncbi:MAG: alpha/beta hydrolase [Cyclobacteriaceae bacterium]|nr:alpha/beta hydrolase [Cyclobacteriaceae bacterium]
MKTQKLLLTALLLTVMWMTGCEEELSVHDPGNLVPRTVDQDPSLPSITVNGAQLHAEAFGNPNDPMLVILHGGPGLDYRYLLNCRAFADHGYRVVFFDQRGAGLSQRFPFESYTQEEMYGDLAGVIDYFRSSPSQKVFLLGHSWGAMLATAYVNRYPSRIDGLILGEPGGLTWADVKDYIARTRKFNPMGENLNDVLYLDQFITAGQNDHAMLDYRFDLWSAASNSAEAPTGNDGKNPHWRSGAVVFNAYLELGNQQNPDWTTELDQYTTKVLFIYSENNRAYGREHAVHVSSAFPNVQLFETLNAGHDMLTFPAGWNNTFPVMLEYLNALK